LEHQTPRCSKKEKYPFMLRILRQHAMKGEEKFREN